MSRSVDALAAEVAGLRPDPAILPGLAARLGLDAELIRSRAYEAFGRFEAPSGGYEYGASNRAVGRFIDRAAYSAAQQAFIEALRREVRHG